MVDKMKKNNFIKISAAIFILLAVIISLFPPFEFGNEKLRTLSERRINSKIIEKLPIKKYDFLFGSNKKYFALDSYTFQKLFTKESLKSYKEKWNDKRFKFIAAIDSFFTAIGFLDQLLLNGNRGLIYKPNYKDYGLVIFRGGIMDTPKNYAIDYSEVLGGSTNFIQNSADYWDVKSKYEKDMEKDPISWSWHLLYRFDSAGTYDKYFVTQPVYYLLDRKILFNELMVEYILDFFVSIIVGYLISKLKIPVRQNLNL